MGEANNELFTLNTDSISACNNTTFTITTSASTTLWINADTGLSFEDPIETMKNQFAILADKFLEKYRDEIV